jgi:hypothetical protein
MISVSSNDLVTRSKLLYTERWKKDLESNHHGSYIAIEPDTQRYFIANNYSEAISAAQEAEPDRLVFVMRVGYPGAIHLGGCTT